MKAMDILKQLKEAYNAQYKIVSAKELADEISTLCVGDEIYFADTWDENVAPENIKANNCENWYGIKVIKAFDSKMAVFNYSGGGKAYVAEIDEELEFAVNYYLRNFVNGTTVYKHVVLEY